ncbi:hypothetical protein [Miltoncostaea oceani]|uniref:hypothetical protein n=1 Tax=Miltoncostaea oceani TaxID=2843216 RepID=UPI001C3CA0FA|nr:hypothetical protein [Miltoncostaea oceani]
MNGQGYLGGDGADHPHSLVALTSPAVITADSATHPGQLQASGDLVGLLTRAGFMVGVEEDGSISWLEFVGEPMGGEHRAAGSLDQRALLQALSPFILAGGAVSSSAEDGSEWIHHFDGVAMTTVEQ